MKHLALLLLSAITAVSPVAADESAAEVFGVMYWTHRDEGVYRAARDGSEAKLLAAIKNADGIALDHKTQKLYFTVSGYPGPNADKLYRGNLDGSGLEEFVAGLLAFDPDNRKLYWTEKGKLCQANADGTQIETLISGKTGQYASLLILPPKEP